jgi:hypothetical protein
MRRRHPHSNAFLLRILDSNLGTLLSLYWTTNRFCAGLISRASKSTAVAAAARPSFLPSVRQEA